MSDLWIIDEEKRRVGRIKDGSIFDHHNRRIGEIVGGEFNTQSVDTISELSNNYGNFDGHCLICNGGRGPCLTIIDRVDDAEQFAETKSYR